MNLLLIKSGSGSGRRGRGGVSRRAEGSCGNITGRPAFFWVSYNLKDTYVKQDNNCSLAAVVFFKKERIHSLL